jgi:gliding motility-associated-like protein
VKLVSSANSGCSGSADTIISVKPPPITGIVTPPSGCIPANVTFTGNATIPGGTSVTNYSWNFGDGSPVAVTGGNTINHVYTSVGSYSPILNITTSEGCTNSYSYGSIVYGTPPTNHVAYPKNAIICGSENAVVVSKAVNANSYTWDFGDGIVTTVTDTVTQHKYKTLGVKNITVTPSFNGCPGTPITFNVTIIGVIASYNFSNTCTDKKTYSFTNTSQGNLSNVSWDFGDGSPVLTTTNTTHTFPASGSFLVKLTVTDNVTGCADTYSESIYTAAPTLLNPAVNLCRNDSTIYRVVNSYQNPSTTYTWNVGGQQLGPLADSSLKARNSIFGNFNDYVVINNGAGYCLDTIRLNHNIVVRGPQLNFTGPLEPCQNVPYIVNNTSKPFIASDSIVLYTWNFGFNNAIDTGYQPPPYLYPFPIGYHVKLKAVDVNGCKDSLVHDVFVKPLPFIYVQASRDTLCLGTADSLFAFHVDPITWSPSASLSCSTCDTVLARPSVTTQYFVAARSSFGCTASDSVLVKVFPPFTASTFTPDIYICLNDSAQLIVSPSGEKITWTPSINLSNTNAYGPIAFPKQNTTYTAMLSDSVGCFSSSVNINVHVKSLPTVNAGPDQTLPYNSSFSINPIYSNNVTSYSWTPVNILNCNTCANPTGVAIQSNTFYLTVTSDSGCVAKDSIRIAIECKSSNLLLPNAFTPNNDNLNDYFYPIGRGIKIILRFSIYDRFGKLVFEGKNFPPNDKTFGWNGRVNNTDLSTSVFVYYIEALCEQGEKLSKRGSVILIR